MNVIEAFTHHHNVSRVAKQDYDLAKAHYCEVCDNFGATNPDHQRRFRDAADRLETARDAYLLSFGT